MLMSLVSVMFENVHFTGQHANKLYLFCCTQWLSKPENNSCDIEFTKPPNFDLTPENDADREHLDHHLPNRDIIDIILDLHENIDTNWAEVSKRRNDKKFARRRLFMECKHSDVYSDVDSDSDTSLTLEELFH